MNLDRMTRLLGVLVAACVILAGSWSPIWATEFKAAKISLPDVYKNSKRINDVEEELQKMQVTLEAKVSPLKEAASKIREQLTSKKDALKKEEREKLEAELREKMNEIETAEVDFKTKVAFRQKTIRGVIGNQIRQIIDKIAKEEGYTVIFSTQTLLYSAGLTDLSSKVLKELDALPALEQPQQ